MNNRSHRGDYLQLHFYFFRRGETIASLHVREYFIIAHPLERKAAECDDLVEQYAVRPDVRRWRENA